MSVFRKRCVKVNWMPNIKLREVNSQLKRFVGSAKPKETHVFRLEGIPITFSTKVCPSAEIRVEKHCCKARARAGRVITQSIMTGRSVIVICRNLKGRIKARFGVTYKKIEILQESLHDSTEYNQVEVQKIQNKFCISSPPKSKVDSGYRKKHFQCTKKCTDATET